MTQIPLPPQRQPRYGAELGFMAFLVLVGMNIAVFAYGWGALTTATRCEAVVPLPPPPGAITIARRP